MHLFLVPLILFPCANVDDIAHFFTQVGDIILLHKNQRVPADMVLLWTSEPNGSCFIRTDQLDGETDWKLRTAVPVTQNIVHEAGRPEALFDIQVSVHVHYEGTTH